MRKSIICALAALACAGVVSGGAQAQSIAFGAGDSSAQIVYRQLMDCLYNQATGRFGPLAKATSCVSFNSSTFGGWILYAPTDSGNGKTVLRTNNKGSIGTPSRSVAYTTIGPNHRILSISDYDGVQFVGTGGDVLNAADIAAWSSARNFVRYGNIIQIPSFISPIAIIFNGKDGNGAPLNILPATPAGGSSGLNLSRKALCGIVSGHITSWDNPILTALNGGVLGTGFIRFVHRGDSSGDTFLLSNALVEQCRYEFGPTSELNPAIASYAFPWTDRAGSCTNPRVPVGASQLNWPSPFSSDSCGNWNIGSGLFANASGSDSLVTQVTSTNGAIGYASAGFGGLRTAHLQSQWDITASTGQFQPPTWQGAQTAMSSAIPRFATAADRANPLAWSLQGVVPNPVVKGSYPIAGFTWIDMYQCYDTHPDNNPLVWFLTWLNYLYGSPNATAILHDNGFAEVPGPWLTEIYALLNDNDHGPRYWNDPSAVNCVYRIGAY